MGSYAECWLDNFLVGSSKNTIDPDLISLFRAADKVIPSPPFETLPQPLHTYRESLEDDSNLPPIYYSARADTVRDRLDVLGYDRDTAELAFREWITAERDRSNEYMEKWQCSDSRHGEWFAAHYRRNAGILRSLTPDSWIQGLRRISASRLEPSFSSKYTGPHEGTLLGYMLSNEWYGFAGDDLFVPLRLAVESLDEGRSLVYDLTDLVWGGYFEYDEDFVEYGLSRSAEEYRAKAKIIVLTEGSTDAWILRKSLHLLFPHLEDYYSFRDFESARYGGGVGNLMNTVRAFSGAGIVNNIIALFDNDTAAYAALKSLNSENIAPNIAIVRLPEMEYLRSYPTIGPSGEVRSDVNGTAASIELYLGDDVLKLDNQHPAPIQWTAYDRTIGRYQGEVLDKPMLHKRFKKKLANHNGIPGPEWDPMRKVLQAIFRAFVDTNRRSICRRASDSHAR